MQRRPYELQLKPDPDKLIKFFEEKQSMTYIWAVKYFKQQGKKKKRVGHKTSIDKNINSNVTVITIEKNNSNVIIANIIMMVVIVITME